MVELILCGRGGQGIVFLTRLIGEIATSKGLGVITSETHGMAVRGGSINSHVRIGPFYSSLVRPGQADFLVSLESAETPNNAHYLKPDGILVENSPLPSEPRAFRCDAAGLARDLGRTQLENVVLLAFAAMVGGFPISSEELRSRLSGDPREDIRTMNLRAMEAGVNAAKSSAAS